MENGGKIGVFDSGLGGLWVLKHLQNELPQYEYVFLADQANMPYGNRTKEEIVNLSFKITDFLISQGCDMVVVACNTATSAAINKLREKYKIPFVGMEPAIKPASENSKTGHIGVLATKLTIEGEKIKETINKFANDVEVHTCVGEGLVELVESCKADTDESEVLLKKYLDPLVKDNIDQLVLGCTHYPFLINRMKKILGDKVNIIDPSLAVTNRVRFLLNEQGQKFDIKEGGIKFLTTGDGIAMQNFVNKFIGDYEVKHLSI